MLAVSVTSSWQRRDGVVACSQILEPVDAAGGCNHLRAMGRQHLGKAPPEAGGRARDQRHLAGEVEKPLCRHDLGHELDFPLRPGYLDAKSARPQGSEMSYLPLVGLPADTYESHGFLFHSIGDKYRARRGRGGAVRARHDPVDESTRWNSTRCSIISTAS